MSFQVAFDRKEFSFFSIDRNAKIALNHISKDSDSKEIQAMRLFLRSQEVLLRGQTPQIQTVNWSFNKIDSKKVEFVANTTLNPVEQDEDVEAADEHELVAVEVSQEENIVVDKQEVVSEPQAMAPSVAVESRQEEAAVVAEVVLKNDLEIELNLQEKAKAVLQVLLNITLMPLHVLIKILKTIANANPHECLENISRFIKEIYKLICNINHVLETLNRITSKIDESHVAGIVKNIEGITGKVAEMTDEIDDKKLKESLNHLVSMLEMVSSLTKQLGDTQALSGLKTQFGAMFGKVNVMLSQMIVDGPFKTLTGAAEKRRAELQEAIKEMKELPEDQKLERLGKLSNSLKMLLSDLGREEDAAAVSVNQDAAPAPSITLPQSPIKA